MSVGRMNGQPRRLRFYTIPQHHLVGVFQSLRERKDTLIYVPTIQGPPSEAALVDVFYDPYSRSFQFLFEHDSFPEVDPGREIPRAIDETYVNLVCLRLTGQTGADVPEYTPDESLTI